MKKLTGIAILLICSISSFSQLTVVPGGGNKKAIVGEQIGVTKITVHYDRPGVKGREGKIWGDLIHKGFADLGFGTSKAAPWRAGANENTTIEFSTDVRVENHLLAAGKYGFFVAWSPEECTLIFSRNADSWGSFFYDEKEDVLRVKVKPVTLDKSVEWLKYEFMNETDTSATIALQWEKIMIPFTVTADVDRMQLESFRKELRGELSWRIGWRSFQEAAQYTADHNVALEEGLAWADQAIAAPFVGEANFRTLSTKATILQKLNRQAEADTVMKRAVPMGSMQDLHVYGRQLIAEKKARMALEVFLANFKKHPNEFTTLMGLTRGYSANGDYKTALKYATQALAVAPGQPAQTQVNGMIEKLKAGKDVN